MCLLNSCATNYAPDGWLREPDEAAQTGYGGWADITLKNDSLLSGELIAVYPDTLFILSNLKKMKADSIRTSGRLYAIPKNKIDEIQVTYYDSQEGAIAVISVLGILSTVTHGFWLSLSAPTWLLGGTTIAAVRSEEPVIEYPDRSWENLEKYARFPQGIPIMIRRDSILTKPYLKD